MPIRHPYTRLVAPILPHGNKSRWDRHLLRSCQVMVLGTIREAKVLAGIKLETEAAAAPDEHTEDPPIMAAWHQIREYDSIRFPQIAFRSISIIFVAVIKIFQTTLVTGKITHSWMQDGVEAQNKKVTNWSVQFVNIRKSLPRCSRFETYFTPFCSLISVHISAVGTESDAGLGNRYFAVKDAGSADFHENCVSGTAYPFSDRSILDDRYGAVHKPKHVSAMMAWHCHTQCDGTPATILFKISIATPRPIEPVVATTSKFFIRPRLWDEFFCTR
ncbi:hypothetical protein CSKR_109034 [Clonorchis sinensis]|uniref:Uncharacterized protein n=1 Tax=Clonorchis sinensis TaxID=79923 RepID=A0A419Q3Y9_CLOSI|nr:hypothetical protein CSKR_109034 [Clonorchis sinensis]